MRAGSTQVERESLLTAIGSQGRSAVGPRASGGGLGAGLVDQGAGLASEPEVDGAGLGDGGGAGPPDQHLPDRGFEGLDPLGDR